MKVLFENVGRNHVSFAADLRDTSYRSLLQAVRPHLMSRDIEFQFDDEGEGAGTVFAGIRAVGRFFVQRHAEAAHA